MRLLPAGRRDEAWTLELLEGDGTRVATLPMRHGSGSDDYQSDRPSPHSMSCELLAEPPALRGRLLRATYSIGGDPHPLGVWVPTASRRTLTEEGAAWRVEGVDQSVLLSRVSLRRPLALLSAAPVAETVMSLVEQYAPQVRVSVPDGDETLRAPLSWDAGTPVLTVVNELLGIAGYRPLQPQPDGMLVSHPMTSGEQAPVGTFRDDHDGMAFLPALELTDDHLSLPNEVLAVSPASSTAPAVVGRWADPAGQARDGIISATIRIEATDQEAADAQAAEHARQLLTAAKSVTITGPWQPITPGQWVALRWSRHELERSCELAGRASQWSPGAESTYTLQEA